MLDKFNKKIDKSKLPRLLILYTIAILIVSIPTYFDAGLTEVFGYSYYHWWANFTYIFEHGVYLLGINSNHWAIFLHMGTNLFIMWFFGYAVEIWLGTDLLLIDSIIAYIVDAFLFDQIFGSAKGGTVGASGIVFSYIPLGIYCYVCSLKANNLSFFKRWQSYLIVLWAAAVFIVPTIMTPELSGALSTLECHVISALVGVFVMIFCMIKKPKPRRSAWTWVMVLPIIFNLVILIAYYLGYIKINLNWV